MCSHIRYAICNHSPKGHKYYSLTFYKKYTVFFWAALLFHLDNYNRSRPSCTSLPCQWKKPPLVQNSPQKVTELKIEKPKIGHTTKEPVLFEPMDRIMGYVSMNRVMQLRKYLSACHTGTLGFHQVWPETVDVRQEAQLVDQLTKWHAVHSEN